MYILGNKLLYLNNNFFGGTMKKNCFYLLLCTFICTFFLSCKDENISGMWKIHSLQKNGISQEICDIDIQIEQNQNVISVAGNSGVNNFSGEFIVNNDGSISVQNLASTKMMGSPAAMEFENLFMELLNGLSSAKIKDENLILENKEANLTATFSKTEITTVVTESTNSNSFLDSKWIVSSIKDTDSLGQNELYIIFSSSDELTAFTGINQIMAPFDYNSEDGTIYIGEGASTLALGSGQENQIEMLFLQNLYNSQKLDFDGSTILLKDGDNNILITLKN